MTTLIIWTFGTVVTLLSLLKNYTFSILMSLIYHSSFACELKKMHTLELCGILPNSSGPWSNIVKWLSFSIMLFLGMERSIFLIKENWQGDLLQCSPGLAKKWEAPGMQTSHLQILTWPRHKRTCCPGNV